jgi:hypothetical protein
VDPVESPCIGVCTIGRIGEPAATLCRGCWRTMDEIARWRAMSRAERAAVIATCVARFRAAGGVGAPWSAES